MLEENLGGLGGTLGDSARRDMRDELTVALFDSALVATRGDSGLLGRWLTLGPWSRWPTRGDSARRGPRRGDSARRAVWRGRGLAGGVKTSWRCS